MLFRAVLYSNKNNFGNLIYKQITEIVLNKPDLQKERFVQKYNPNISGKKRLVSIINPAVKLNQSVNKTGAVDKYF